MFVLFVFVWFVNLFCYLGFFLIAYMSEIVLFVFLHLTFFFFFFFALRATPMANGSSQGRGQIRAIATGLHYSYCNAISEQRLQPTQLLAMMDP